VLFSVDAHAGLAAGSISVTFRRWTRAQAKVGSRHRVGGIELAIDAVSQVRVGDLTEADARRAGAADLVALTGRLGGDLGPDDLVWKVEFHVAGRDIRQVLAEQASLSGDERADLDRRLDRLDRSGRDGPWTRVTLALVGERPGVVSTELAAALGRDRAAFKLDVRKLKALGLTESLEVGYRLSPRGRAFLDDAR
jgi:hypothetical protein